MVAKKYFTEEEILEAKRKQKRKDYWLHKERDLEHRREIQRQYYHRNRERLSLKNKAWRENNPEKVREGQQRYHYSRMTRRDYDIQYRLWSTSKTNAKRREMTHDISKDDINVPTCCPYLGVELYLDRDRARKPYTPSIDRIDSKLGYIKDNIQVISYLANQMKSYATEEQLISFAKGVLRIHAGIDVDKVPFECRQLHEVPALYSN